jgi:hypothetical protein
MLSSILTFWTTLTPLVLFLQMFWKFFFQNSFANSQRYMNKNFEKHFQDLKFSPPVSNAFPLTKQNSPFNEILLLVFKRVLDIDFEEGIPI